MEQLNGNIHYQIFCDVIIDPTRPLTNYKLLDDIILELSGKLKIQQQQDILAEQGLSREHKGQDSEHQQTVCEADSERQGSEER